MYYLIDTMLRNCSAEECHGGEFQYVVVLSPEEWSAECDSYEMGIDMEPDTGEMFAFALDEKGIVFIDSGDTVSKIINRIIETKKWRMPSLKRFIYDFLEQIIHEDPRILENYEKRLDVIDNDIDCGKEGDLDALNDIRGELRDLRTHYNQLDPGHLSVET